MIRRARIAGLVLVGTVIATHTSCANRHQLLPHGPAIDDLDYMREGIARFELYASQEQPEWDRLAHDGTLENIVQVTVRTTLEKSWFDESYTDTSGTGCLLASSKLVLTAGHLLDDMPENTEIIVHFPSGERVRAEPVFFRHERFETGDLDIGLLRLAAAPPTTGVRIESEAAVHQADEVFIAAGFPGGTALGTRGELLPADELKTFRPLCAALRRDGTSQSSYELVAGCMPLEGMSGAPILSRDGVCVGVLSGVRVSFGADGSSTTRVTGSPGLGLALDTVQGSAVLPGSGSDPE